MELTEVLYQRLTTCCKIFWRNAIEACWFTSLQLIKCFSHIILRGWSSSSLCRGLLGISSITLGSVDEGLLTSCLKLFWQSLTQWGAHPVGSGLGLHFDVVVHTPSSSWSRRAWHCLRQRGSPLPSFSTIRPSWSASELFLWGGGTCPALSQIGFPPVSQFLCAAYFSARNPWISESLSSKQSQWCLFRACVACLVAVSTSCFNLARFSPVSAWWRQLAIEALRVYSVRQLSCQGYWFSEHPFLGCFLPWGLFFVPAVSLLSWGEGGLLSNQHFSLLWWYESQVDHVVCTWSNLFDASARYWLHPGGFVSIVQLE